jgi:hypothetical protein
MNETTRLEHWYRRMLTWYPAGHRRAYGEEMIGVLLASAPQGKRRPGIADTLDLVKGALLVRLRAAGNNHADAGWRDTLAVFSIAAPVMTIAYCLAAIEVRPIVNVRPMTSFYWGHHVVRPELIALALVIPPLLALVPRLRWPAIAAASVPAIAFCYFMVWELAHQASPVGGILLVWFSIFFVLELVALAISPGPRRGAQIMTRPAWAVTTGVVVLAGLATGQEGRGTTLFTDLQTYPVTTPILIFRATMPVAVVAVVIGLLLTLPAPTGTRLLLLLAIPGYPTAIAMFTSSDRGLTFYTPVMRNVTCVCPIMGTITYIPRRGSLTLLTYYLTTGRLALVILPTIALAGMAAALAWRSGHRGSASQHRGTAVS